MIELGSVHEGKDNEEEQAYVSGLRQAITELRSKGTTDITAAASEIVAYRARFLNDPTRILTCL